MTVPRKKIPHKMILKKSRVRNWNHKRNEVTEQLSNLNAWGVANYLFQNGVG